MHNFTRRTTLVSALALAACKPTDPATPVVTKFFFKKIDASGPLTRLTEALREILASDPEIRDVVWSESAR